MVVTATVFQSNFIKYLELLTNDSIFITMNGKTVAKVINPNVSAVDEITDILADSLPDGYDQKALRSERLSKYFEKSV